MNQFLTLAFSLLLPAVAVAASFDHTHAAFDGVLKQHVNGGWVDYAALKANPKPLDSYLAQLAAVSEKRLQRLA